LNRTFLYFGGLTLFISLATPVGYLVDIQMSYMLKNQLHATATQVSIFRLITAVPMYVAFLFGLLRDHWNPLGMRDRGFFLIFGLVTAAAYLGMAFAPITYEGLLIGMLLTMVSFRFVGAAFEGLMALIGQEELVSGRLSVVWQIVTYIPYIAGALASGYISSHLAPRSTFVIVAIVAAGLALIGLWKPRAVFSHAYDKPQARATTFTADVARLVRHRAIYAPVLMMFLWSFAPGANTPLQFYLTNTLHASDAVYSYYNAVFVASFIPTMVLYGYLCKRVPLEKLLWWGAAIAVPQMIPLLFIHSGDLAIAMAVPIGLLGGVITVGIYDLSMRSCPSGLQGTMMMLVEGALFAASRGGDVLGSKIYGSSPTNGFLYCVIATTIVYALILPLILLVPKQLMATTDGEAIPAPA